VTRPAQHETQSCIAYFTARDGSPLLTAAGLWEEWKDRQSGERLKSCTMIVTAPNNFAA
jgi:putative SOS response-associated peptidase YedK